MALNRSDSPSWGQRKKAALYRLDLIWHLVRRDFILRYRGSALGLVWSIGPALLQLAVLVFLFRKVIQLGIEGYPAFVFASLLPWVWFSSSVSSAGSLFLNNRDLVRRPDFTPSHLVAIHTLSNFLSYLTAFPILIVLLIVYRRDFTPSLLVLPLLMLVQGVLINGLALIVATLNVFYRDVQHLVGLAITLAFYMTPVFYRIEGVGKEYQFLFRWNPLSTLIESYRTVLFYGRIPSLQSLLFIASVSGFAVGLGYYIYSRALHEVVDRV